MRSRVARASFWDDPDLCGLDSNTRLIFFGLWCMADSSGRLNDDPRLVRAKLFLYRDNVSVDGVDKCLCTLHDAGLIVRYEVESARLIEIPRFKSWTSVYEKEPASKLPAPAYQGATKNLDSASVNTRTNTRTRTEELEPEPTPEPTSTPSWHEQLKAVER